MCLTYKSNLFRLSAMDIPTPPHKAALYRAAEMLGAQAGVSKRLGYEDRRNVSPWFTTDRFLPPEHCVSIEQATGGAVTRRDLRPNDWQAIWPELADKQAA